MENKESDYKSHAGYAIMCKAIPKWNRLRKIYDNAEITFYNQHLKVDGRRVKTSIYIGDRRL